MITEPYTLFSRIVLYQAEDGTFYADPLWQRDLTAHFAYLSNFRICCPVEPLSQVTEDLHPVPGLRNHQVTPLRKDRGWGSVIRNITPNFRQVVKAIRATEIAHSGGAGWAFPLSYYLLLVRLFRRFQWIIVIESSFWMKPKRGRVSLRQWLSHHIHMVLITRCTRRADARIFTQDWYRRLFLGHERNSLVAPAVWVDSAQILDAPPLRDRDGLRFLFPARLIASKGIETVLAAINLVNAQLSGSDVPVPGIDIIGTGPLVERCRTTLEGRGKKAQLLNPVPYGEPFFSLLRSYDAVIVANEQDEQPRIVFDAYSQGVPVIGTRTEGMRNIHEDGQTGFAFDIGDAEELAGIICDIATGARDLGSMPLQALSFARTHSHAGMHRRREAFLKETLKLDGEGASGAQEVSL